MLKGKILTKNMLILSETLTVCFAPGLRCQQMLDFSNNNRLATISVRLFQSLFYLDEENIQQIKQCQYKIHIKSLTACIHRLIPVD